MLGIHDADHEETAASGATLFVSKLSCSLVGQTHMVNLLPDSRVFQIYGKAESAEPFFCNYGLNQNYRHVFDGQEMKIVGVDESGEIRIIELPKHRFFIATLFVPQLASSLENPHPLIMAYLQAAWEFRMERVKNGVMRKNVMRKKVTRKKRITNYASRFTFYITTILP